MTRSKKPRSRPREAVVYAPLLGAALLAGGCAREAPARSDPVHDGGASDLPAVVCPPTLPEPLSLCSDAVVCTYNLCPSAGFGVTVACTLYPGAGQWEIAELVPCDELPIPCDACTTFVTPWECRDARAACDENPSCTSFEGCYLDCEANGLASCFTLCAQLYPEGAEPYAALRSCTTCGGCSSWDTTCAADHPGLCD